ncbi:MAG: trehalose-phosphatase [Candidatus Wallbacteria bacterium]|nr:trehalose-phosphatase [Candidatus Wallbacteria bacterium]
MKYLLEGTARGVLEEFARSNVLLAFDFDGTLAPIVSKPDTAQMRPSTRERLQQVSRRYPCAVVTGRAQADALQRINQVDVWDVIGNHGVEPGSACEEYRALTRDWLSELEPVLNAVEGVRLEDKQYSLAVHYRECRNKTAAARLIRARTAKLRDSRIVPGKLVINVVPRSAPDKGAALVAASERLYCERILYVGDDVTDEDAFGCAGPDRLLAVRVGRTTRSKAPYFIRNQREIDALLDVLIQARPGVTEDA